MFGKLADTAQILKAKINKDELQEKLIQATSEENWQTPTNILHDIANSAYNYEKWQKINDFIWEKLKKKTTWRKIMKTLNLVDFLIRNGPPSTISSFKYDIYQFRSYSDYQIYEEGVDRGQGIREKAKVIVELLGNDEFLEEERQKAKKIRQRMSGITGGVSYGREGYGGNSNGAYQSYNSKNFGQKKGYNYGNSDQVNGGLGVYGDYTSGKSALDKYRGQKDKNTSNNTPSNIPDITGGLGGDKPKDKPNVTQTQTLNQPTPTPPPKPFNKEIKRLQKPTVDITGGLGGQTTPSTQQKPNVNKNNNIIDDDLLFGGSTTPQVQPQIQQPKPQVPQVQPQTEHSQFTQPQVQPQVPSFHNLYNQPYLQQQQQIPQQQTPQSFYQQPNPNTLNQSYQGNYQQPQQLYQQPQQFYQQPYQQSYQQPYQQSYQQPIQQPVQQLNQQTYQQQSFNYQQAKPQQVSLNLTTSADDQFGNFQSAPSQSTANVKWLSNNEKGLIDFSDFGSDMKNAKDTTSTKPRQQKGNNIKIDAWNW